MTRLLDGRRGVVVGVSGERSVGGACARALRELGAEVAITCRPGRVDSVAGIGDATLVMDVDDEAAVDQAFAELDTRFRRLDFLVHSIMHVPPGLLDRPLTEVDRASFSAVLAAGVHSLISVCKRARPLLARSTAARVVTITSPCGHRMTPHYHVAGIAKAALESAVLYLAYELGPAGILCNAVSPGLIDTDGAVAVVGADAAASTRTYMARRAATRNPTDLTDVAASVAWLCSPMLRNMTGEVMAVDGGYARSYF
jgi:enoyl-[acyl-carrier protein] reductase I